MVIKPKLRYFTQITKNPHFLHHLHSATNPTSLLSSHTYPHTPFCPYSQPPPFQNPQDPQPYHFITSFKTGKKMAAASFTGPVVAGSRSSYAGLTRASPDSSRLFPCKNSTHVSWGEKVVSNGARTHCMKTWNPFKNKKFETMSYLPPLSAESIIKEIDYMISKGWVPCLEFDEVGHVSRVNSRMPNYYDGRYWTLWKLPMFGCRESSHVVREMEECKKAYPNAYIRCLAFDNTKQAQCMAFLVHTPHPTN